MPSKWGSKSLLCSRPGGPSGSMELRTWVRAPELEASMVLTSPPILSVSSTSGQGLPCDAVSRVLCVCGRTAAGWVKLEVTPSGQPQTPQKPKVHAMGTPARQKQKYLP